MPIFFINITFVTLFTSFRDLPLFFIFIILIEYLLVFILNLKLNF
jgi:hypothetical protein